MKSVYNDHELDILERTTFYIDENDTTFPTHDEKPKLNPSDIDKLYQSDHDFEVNLINFFNLHDGEREERARIRQKLRLKKLMAKKQKSNEVRRMRTAARRRMPQKNSLNPILPSQMTSILGYGGGTAKLNKKKTKKKIVKKKSKRTMLRSQKHPKIQHRRTIKKKHTKRKSQKKQ